MKSLKDLSPWEARILRFTVGVSVGLAPFLGYTDVPGFTAVIRMYPESLQSWLIPISGLLMGAVGVVVEFLYGERTPKKRRRAWFKRTMTVFLGALVVLIVLYVQFVVRVDKTVMRDGVPQVVQLAVITGTLEVPQQWEGSPCTCRPRQPARVCLTEINLNPDHVATCFGAQRIALATLALALVYLVVTASFAAAIGVLMLVRRGAVPATITA